MEIERKFLLKYLIYHHDLPKHNIQYTKYLKITQHYLPEGLRLRKTVFPGMSEHFTMTLKADVKGKFIRQEWETKIPKWVYQELSSKPGTRSLTKDRYCWNEGDNKFFLDRFQFQHEFCVLEVEFPDTEAAVRFDTSQTGLPIEREVTYDLSYYNYNMAN